MPIHVTELTKKINMDHLKTQKLTQCVIKTDRNITYITYNITESFYLANFSLNLVYSDYTYNFSLRIPLPNLSSLFVSSLSFPI